MQLPVDEMKILVAVRLYAVSQRLVMRIGNGAPMLGIQLVGIRREIGGEIVNLPCAQAGDRGQIAEDWIGLLLLIVPLLLNLRLEAADRLGVRRGLLLRRSLLCR